MIQALAQMLLAYAAGRFVIDLVQARRELSSSQRRTAVIAAVVAWLVMAQSWWVITATAAQNSGLW